MNGAAIRAMVLCLLAAGSAWSAPPSNDKTPASAPASRPELTLKDLRANLRQHLELSSAAGLKEKAFRSLLDQAAGEDDSAEQALRALRKAVAFSREIHPKAGELRQALPMVGMELRVLEALLKVAVETFNDGEIGAGQDDFPQVVDRLQKVAGLALGGRGKYDQSRNLLEQRDRVAAAFNKAQFGPGRNTFETLLARLDEAAGRTRPATQPVRDAPAQADAQGPEWMRTMLDLHNTVRRQQSLPMLTLDRKLTLCAQKYAEYLAATGKFGHNEKGTPAERVRQEGYVYRMTGENLAWGRPTAAATFQGWMDSPPHKQNILTPYTQVGFGLARRSDGALMWCAVFGTPR